MKQTIHFKLRGVDCAGCAGKIETALSRLDGVVEASVSVASQMLTLKLAPDSDAAAQVPPLLNRLGYAALPLGQAGAGSDASDVCDGAAEGIAHGHHHHDHGFVAGATWWQQRGAQLVFAAAGAMVTAWLLGVLYPPIATWAFVAALLVGFIPIARRAVAAAAAGVFFSIEMLMTVAAVGAVVIGSAAEAGMVVLLFLVGELLEGITAERARTSISKLAELVPKQAFARRADGSFAEVDAATLSVGDVIRVRPGDRIAADGQVIEGRGSVNEAPVTGESVPREKTVGDVVFAGTVNGESALLVAVTAAAVDNTIARVIRLVEQAQQTKAPLARFIDRFARRYTPAIALLALLTACVPPLLGGSWGEWVYKALALLLIGCPCALVISTPTAVAAGLSAGARRGLLMKGGVVLENAGRLGVIAFDKTGTLTQGAPEVTDVVGLGNVSETKVLLLAASLEAGSSHPLALAVLAEAARRGTAGIAADNLGTLAGRGVRGQVEGVAYFLGSARSVAGEISLDAALCTQVDALAGQGKTVSLLVQLPQGAQATARTEIPLDSAVNVASDSAVGTALGTPANVAEISSALPVSVARTSAAVPSGVSSTCTTGKEPLDGASTDGSESLASGKVIGMLAMRDALRTDASAGIVALQRRGIRCVMLTGDSERAARAIGAKLGIEVYAGLLPQDKQRIVTELKAEANAQGKLVGVVGDGINDAPALATADIGIAMGGGTDVALETADAAILRSNVTDVAAMLRLSGATLRNIYQNISFAIGFKAIFLVTTLLGITGLWPAILADTGATVLVTLNAMRLLRKQ